MISLIVVLCRWKPELSEEDAKQLVRDAIRAGIFNDMGSGSNVDLVVLKAKDDVSDLSFELCAIIFYNKCDRRFSILEGSTRPM